MRRMISLAVVLLLIAALIVGIVYSGGTMAG